MSPAHTATPAARPEPTREQVRRWRRYLADEIADISVTATFVEGRQVFGASE